MKKNKGVTIDKCVIGQEYWLDSCMDESGIYAGNGKWIPTIRKYYSIDHDGLINLDGGYFYPKSNSVKAESGNTMRIPIPTGHTAKIENNTVIFEPKTAKFKKGDFVKTDNSYAIIKNAATFEVYVEFFLHSKNLYELGYTESKLLRLMADSEKQILLDKLHESGKDWDAERCEIVDYIWRPKIGEIYYSFGAKMDVTDFTWNEDSFDNNYYNSGAVFRTRKLAESALELLKQAKHY